jgi:hypothetical protein
MGGRVPPVAQWPEPRPLNLDPGYLTEAKLVLATTKDRNHRLYLDRGIFAEVTLCYQRGGSGWRASGRIAITRPPVTINS